MLYDAIFLSSDEVLKGQQGRKAVVLFSDGVDRDSKTSLQRAIESAQRADTLVYCVYVAPSAKNNSQRIRRRAARRRRRRLSWRWWRRLSRRWRRTISRRRWTFPGGGRRRGPESTPRENKTDGKKILQQIAKETGGRYFELSKKQTAAQIYAQIEEEMRHQYSLSYTPDKAENGYHKLHLSTRNGDLTVQTREGFYSE